MKTDRNSILEELAKRCEAGTGPDRELDTAIEQALPCSHAFEQAHPGKNLSQWNEAAFAFYRVGDEGRDYISPSYTVSIDAAMTLVPEGWRRWIYDADDGRCICRLEQPDGKEVGANGVSWPLAICAAALRSQQSKEG
jgi:hypothetical protein